ncbi:hypothetical protein D3C87_1372130 [compost metagenome]
MQVRGDYAQDRIALPGGQVAFDDLGIIAHRFSKLIGGFGMLGLEPDAGKDREAQPELGPVEHRNVLVNNAFFLKQLHPP